MATRLQKLGKTLKNTGLSLAAGMTYGAFGAPGMAAVGAAGAGYSAIKNILKKDKDEKEEKVERQPSFDNSILEKILGTLQSIESALSNSPVARKTHETKAEKFARIASDVKSGRMSPSEAVQTLVTRKEKNMMAEQALSAAGIKTDDKQYAKLKNDILQGIENELNSETGINAIWEELQKSNEFLETMVKGNEEQQFEADKKQDELISAIKSRDSDGKPEEKKGGLFSMISSFVSGIGSTISGLLKTISGFIPSIGKLIPMMLRFFGPAGLVALAGAVGYWIGGKINEWFADTFKVSIGEGIYNLMEWLQEKLPWVFGKSDKQKQREADQALAVVRADKAIRDSVVTQSKYDSLSTEQKGAIKAPFTTPMIIPKEIEGDTNKGLAWLASDENKNFTQAQKDAAFKKIMSWNVKPSQTPASSQIEQKQNAVDRTSNQITRDIEKKELEMFGNVMRSNGTTVIPVPAQPASPAAQSMPEARNPDNTFLRLSDRMFVPSML